LWNILIVLFRKVFIAITFLVLVSYAGGSVARPDLETLLTKAGISADQVGMIVEDQNGAVFSLNETRKLVPASLTKILTAGACLHILRPEYQFKTRIMASAVIINGVLDGPIYLKGGGDPSFDTKKLKELIRVLSQTSIRVIHGDLIVDDSRFDDLRFDNWKSIKELLTSWNGFPLFVNLDPPKNVDPFMRLWPKSERNARAMLISKSRDYVIYKNMTQPDLWTGFSMARMLKDSRIQLKGVVTRGVVPADAHELAEVESPLPEVLSKMMKESNNFMAETLTRNLAAEAGQTPTIEAGLNIIRQFMDEVGVPQDEYHLVSGAGYSHENYMSVATLCKVLNHMKEDMALYPSFLTSLPIAGIDGTLRHRMRRTLAQGRVHAKTGGLPGVVGLAGYVTPASGGDLTFAFIYNGPKQGWIVKKTFDDICVELTKYPTALKTASQ